MEKILPLNFFFKVFSSIVGLLASFALVLFISKNMSGEEFGMFNYYITLGFLLIYLLSAGFTDTFVYYFSKNQSQQTVILKIYLLLNLFLFFIFIFIVIFLINSSFFLDLLFNQKKPIKLIILGISAGLFNYLFERLGEVYDSLELSKRFDLIKIITRCVILLSIILLFKFENFNLENIFYTIIIIYLSSIFILLLNNRLYLKSTNYTSKPIFNSLLKNYVKFAPMVILAVIYQLVTRIVINADLGIVKQGIYGMGFLIFSSASIPFASLLTIFLSYASKNQIAENLRESEYYFSLFNKVIAPASVLCFSTLVIFFNPMINFLSTSSFILSKLSLMYLSLWGISIIYSSFIFQALISTYDWKAISYIRSILFLLLIIFLTIMFIYKISFSLDFYFLILLIGMIPQLIYVLLISFRKFKHFIFIHFKYLLIIFLSCYSTVMFYFLTNNIITSTLIMFVISIIYFYNVYKFYKEITIYN